MVKRRLQVNLVTIATIAIASVLALTVTLNYGVGTELEEYTYSQVYFVLHLERRLERLDR
jgi:hypothetical protein